MKHAIAFLLILIAAFCAYGFITSWEPGPRAIYFRIGYSLMSLVCAAVAAVLLLAQRQKF